ncbi:caspase family protein [Iningainema tapete]|uniref:Caspase family protein n=1 Tax=Iningainema tapete BLCC-T55 TaxID=2748662 RepID=A0A8J6XF98_9CYAN|nr:caspase family protein [Iningainema tapete]MBD2774579.1 caspase family protein [Iningainema tapete BLCC-T55]
MANNWAIAIGINQYHFFQPLGCAQADAEALRNFLVAEGGFLPQQCLLMTDTSPPLGDRSTYPTKENILLLLEDLAAACWQPQDRLWFFFSGYGVNHKGHDYLMPVEGNPDYVEQTGIEVRQILQSLQVAGLDTLVLLDINRAFGIQADALIGQETIDLAQELRVSTILSCQPEQFSHESGELGHGFFTAALLEALRFGNSSTLVKLERYLSTHTPELCQLYWRPTQNPVSFIKSTEQIILPQWEVKIDRVSAPVGEKEQGSRGVGVQFHVRGAPENWNLFSPSLPSFPTPPLPHSPPPPLPHSLPPQLPLSPSFSGASNYHKKKTANASFWQWFLLWGATTLLVLGLIMAFIRHKTGFKVEQISTSTKTTTTKTIQVLIPKVTMPTPIPVELEIVKTIPTPIPVEPEISVSRQSALISQQKLRKASLELANMSLNPNQASDISLAIVAARKIKLGEPLYGQAQDNIKIWSRMILDLAESRAKQKQLTNAMAAAQLIGKEDLLYPKAQAAIIKWRRQAKQSMTNEALLDAASALIQPKQASTYNRAIEVVKKILPGEPGFDDAKKSMDTWGEKILSLATRRAAKGDFQAAVETAVLVPKETAAYNKAQAAIKKWQKK